MKRMDLKLPKYRRKGMWRFTMYGQRFTPACVLGRVYAKWCRPITRRYILREEKERLCL